MLGVVIITSQKLGADGRGIISYLLLLLTLSIALADFVGGSSLVNLSAKHKMIDLILPTYLAVFLLSGCLMIYLTFFSSLFSFWDHLILSFTAILVGIFNINLNILLGRKKINLRNTLHLLQSLLFLLLIIIGFLIVGTGYIFYFYALFFSYFIVVLYTFIALKNNSQSLDFSEFRLKKVIFQFGFWSQCAQLINLLNFRLSYFFVENHFGFAKLGLFSNAMTVGDMLKISGQSIGQIQHNQIINYNKAVYNGVKKFNQYFLLNLFIYILQGVFVLMLPAVFWIYLLGAEFASLSKLLLYLVPAFILLGISTIFSHFFHAINHFKTNLLSNILGLFAFISIYFLTKNQLGFQAILIGLIVNYAVILATLYICFILLKTKHQIIANSYFQTLKIFYRLVLKKRNNSFLNKNTILK